MAEEPGQGARAHTTSRVASGHVPPPTPGLTSGNAPGQIRMGTDGLIERSWRPFRGIQAGATSGKAGVTGDGPPGAVFGGEIPFGFAGGGNGTLTFASICHSSASAANRGATSSTLDGRSDSVGWVTMSSGVVQSGGWRSAQLHDWQA